MRTLLFILFTVCAYAADAPAEPPSSEEVQVKPEGSPPSFTEDIYQKQFSRTLIVSIVVILFAIFVVWMTRRLSKNRPLYANHHKNLKILERRQISPSTYLYHMQIGNKQFVISESKCDVRLVATLDWSDSETTA